MARSERSLTAAARAWVVLASVVLASVGAALLLAAAPAVAGTFPGKNGKIVYEYLDTIYTIGLGDLAGQQLVTHPDGGGEPSWSPRGDRLAFVSVRDGASDIYVIDADGGGERRLTSNDAIEERYPSWVDDDTVIFRADPDSGDPSFSTADLGAAPTSTYALFRTAEPEVIDNFIEPEISAGGELLFTEDYPVPGTSKFRSAAWTATGNGAATRFSGIMAEYSVFSGGWSPDGGKILYVGRTPTCCSLDVFVDSAASAPVNITNTTGRSETDPRFSPDGTMVVYGDLFGGDNLYVRAADGSGEVTLPTGFFEARNPDWQAIGGFSPPADPVPDSAPAPASAPSVNSGPGPDVEAPSPRLRGRKRQSSTKAVVVRVRCNESCSVAVRPRGRARVSRPGAKAVRRKLSLSTARAKLGAGKTKKLSLRFKGRRTKKLVGAALASKRGKVVLTLRAVATDGAGNRGVGQIRVRLQR